MPRLLSAPGEHGSAREYPVNGPHTSIGRRGFNDVVIDHRSVSGEHALITREGQDHYLEDLNSTNGTFINGRYVKRQRLEHNDTIEIGGCLLRFLADDAAPGQAAVPMGPRGAASGAPATSTLPVGLGPQPAMVKVLSGEAAGRELVLTKAVTTLGKPGLLLASITRRPSGYTLAHVEGRLRASLNGTPLADEAMPLYDGDLIDLAGTQMKFIGA